MIRFFCRDNQIITLYVSAVRTIARAYGKIAARRAVYARADNGEGGGRGNIFFLDRREMNFVALVPVKHGNDAPWARSRTPLPRSSADGHLVGWYLGGDL